MNWPRVTEIISPWSGLDKIPEATLQHAAERGSLTHDYNARIAKGEFVMTIDVSCIPYVQSFRKWFDQMVDEVVLVEERMVDESWGYTGQIDLLIKSKSDGMLWLVDEKTPTTSYKTWRLQLAAYHNLVVNRGYSPSRIGSLQLSPAGRLPRMKWYKNTAQDFNLFTQALNLHRFFNGE